MSGFAFKLEVLDPPEGCWVLDRQCAVHVPVDSLSLQFPVFLQEADVKQG